MNDSVRNYNIRFYYPFFLFCIFVATQTFLIFNHSNIIYGSRDARLYAINSINRQLQKAHRYERLSPSRHSILQTDLILSHNNPLLKTHSNIKSASKNITLILPVVSCNDADTLIKQLVRKFGPSIKYHVVLLKSAASINSSASDIYKCRARNVAIITDHFDSWHRHVLSKITTNFVFVVTTPIKLAKMFALPDIYAYLQFMTENHIDSIGFPSLQLHIDGNGIYEPFSSCHQLTTERYELDIRPNLNQVESHDIRGAVKMCAICDYLSTSSLIIRAERLKSASKSGFLSIHVALLDKFIGLHLNSGTLNFLCVDDVVMSPGIPQTFDVSSLTRRQLTPIARSYDFARITVQSRLSLHPVTHDFTYANLNIGCKKDKGLVLSKICYDELLQGLYDINEYARSLGIFVTANAGNVFGSMKLGGLLPWERDSDVDVPFSALSAFRGNLKSLKNMNSAYWFRNEPYCSKDARGNYRKCGRHYFDFHLKHWRIQVFAETILFQRTRGNLTHPTRMRIGADWFTSPTNPNLYLRNYYSGAIYKHVEHYEFKGMSTKSYRNLRVGSFARCAHKQQSYHGCLRNYLVEGGIQFADLTV